MNITVVGVSPGQAEKLNDKINCIQRTNSIQELVYLYNKADIFVNPTLYDNFPTVNLEAQACGTPVITFNTGGSGESILEGLTGKIVDRGNYHILLKAIKTFPRKTYGISNEIRKNSELYSLKNMTNKYIELYSKINL